ncbi:MAG: choice-of-anchor B family protein [Planctomycetes bacterium]|nr:choice-of-anchor B family protein [Planctomycetota bacterium]
MLIKKALLAAGIFAASISAQGVNCALLGTFNNHGPFNDIWGYTAPNGDEYALLCSTTGTVVVDVTNPSNPIERGWLPFGSSSWRDCRTYGNYAYVVTESTSGFQIIDLSNPNNPVSLGAFGTNITNNAHNVCIDTGTGRLYLVGTNAGTPVWDLTGNPANPTYLGSAGGSGNSNYFHDLCVENGYFYGSMIYNGDLRIADATNVSPSTLSSTQTPGNFTHNAWPNAAGTLCVTTDEVSGGVIAIYDITNKSNPIGLSTFTPNPSAIPHNAFIVGDKVHVSWYTEGYRCIDISDPSNPVEVASYDTWPGSSGGFNGCWGVYPFLPSGNILVSDRSTGLYIVRPSNASFTKFGQGCPGSASASCPELNPAGGTLEGDTRDNEYCYTASANGAINIASVDLFTQSTGSTLSRPVHIYPQAGNGPAANPIASTTVTIGPSAQFYTATFNSPVTVSGTFYIGLDSSPNNVIICSLTSGASGTGYYRDLVNGPANWTLSGLVDRPSYRVNCTGGSTLTPAIGNAGLPTLNSTYNVTLEDAIPQTFAICVSGLSDTVYNGGPLPLALPGAPGCDLYVAADVLDLFITDAQGTASAPFSIPATPANIGVNLYHQWAVLDAVNALGVVVSEAGRATVDQ